jgi:fatty acid desaturase
MSIDVSECRLALEDLRAPSAKAYFADTGVSALAGWVAFGIAMFADSTAGHLVSLGVASLLLFRALAFIHELFHQQQLRYFRWFWHVVAGIPLLLPLLLYLPIHQPHHSAQAYGTVRDGEYEQFRGRRVGMSLRLLSLNLLLPLALAVRFGVLTPLSWLIPVVRREVIPAFVHLSLRMPFKAPEIRGAAAAEAKWVELACMVWSWTLIAALFAGLHVLVGMWAVLLILVAMLNTLRALCSTHLYVEQHDGRDALGQLADSLNIGSNGLMTKLLCPVGLQYHALHHLAPYLPYHALPEAHRRLMARLPADSLYHQVTVPSLFQGWQRLVRATDVHVDSGISRTSAP